ncbi:MAG: hypothetical protein WBV79_10425, partial [Rhodomicrobium sp.]
MTGREADERRAFGRGGAIFYNALKMRHILSLTNWPLNLILITHLRQPDWVCYGTKQEQLICNGFPMA